MLAVAKITERRLLMSADPVAVARERLERATGLSAVLDAAYDAFGDMLQVIESLQDPGGGEFAAFMMSGGSAASGRDAVAAAPSLPAASPAAPANAGQPAAKLPPDVTVRDAAMSVAALSQVLVGRLADARGLATDPGDRIACAEASRHAAEICALLDGARGR
jgi:hypothetical protein